jgi:hypothetical protein
MSMSNPVPYTPAPYILPTLAAAHAEIARLRGMANARLIELEMLLLLQLRCLEAADNSRHGDILMATLSLAHRLVSELWLDLCGPDVHQAAALHSAKG